MLLLIVLLYRWCLCVCDYCLLFVSTVFCFGCVYLFVCSFWLAWVTLFMIDIRLIVVVLLALSVCWCFGLLWCDCAIVGCFAQLICLVFYCVVVCVCLWLFLFVCCYLCSFTVECWCFTVGMHLIVLFICGYVVFCIAVLVVFGLVLVVSFCVCCLLVWWYLILLLLLVCCKISGLWWLLFRD